MKSFKHFNVHSLDEAMARLNEYPGKASLIAGGTDLLGILKDEILPDYPRALVNLKTVLGLDLIEEGNEGLRMGALVRLSRLGRSSAVTGKYALLAQAAESVATPQIRNMGTVAGNLCQDNRCWYYRYPHAMGGRILCYRKGEGPCHAVKGDNRYHAILGGKKCFAVCPSDMAVALSALDGEIRIAGPDGERIVPVTDFYQVTGHILKPNEIVTEIRVPRPPSRSAQAFHKFRLRESVDFAVVSVASLITVSKGVCEDARIVLGAVAPIPYRARAAEDAIRGKPLDEAAAQRAAEAAVGKAKPLRMNAYKVEIAKTLVRRAVLSTSATRS